jgi:phage/plasmid-like protein (TIGR03299 family)
MAHEIDTTKGYAAMAYVGATPWHGLGQEMEAGQSIEKWLVAAGMNFSINEAEVMYKTSSENVYAMAQAVGKKVLFRSDTGSALSVVSNDYQVVQPQEVLEFYRDLTEQAGFNLETAGVLRNGKKYWALANMGEEAKILDDTIKGYLLLGTSCDGSMATTAMFTSIRVVCNNTLGFAMHEADSGKAQKVVRTNHRAKFNAEDIKAQLGIAATSWQSFTKMVGIWANAKVSDDQAKQYFDQIATYKTADGIETISPRTSASLISLYAQTGIGRTLEAANGTAWGLVNAVTEFVDHRRGRSNDVRVDRAWFGDGLTTKNKAVDLVNELIAA